MRTIVRFFYRYFRQWLNIGLCILSAILCGILDNPLLTILLWALVAVVNLEWVFSHANRAYQRRIRGWMKW